MARASEDRPRERSRSSRREKTREFIIDVSLASGSSRRLHVHPNNKISDVKLVAIRCFNAPPCLELILPNGRIATDVRETLEEAGISDGDTLMAIIQKPQLAATDDAFALWSRGGSAVSWGYPWMMSHSSVVQDQLKNVQNIIVTNGAFAALLTDGSVVSWGEAPFGDDSSAVSDQLKNVREIEGNMGAFAAILQDGSVVTWGCDLPTFFGNVCSLLKVLF